MTTARAKLTRATGPLVQFAATLALLILVATVGWILIDEARDRARRGCERGIEDRRVSVLESWSAYRANVIVSLDPAQPARTRQARADQAEDNLKAVRSREARLPRALRVTPAGRDLPEFNCDSA